MVFPFKYAQEGVVERAPKARALRRVWGHAPPDNFYFRAPEIPFTIFSREKFHKSKYVKTLTIQ